MNLMAGEYGFTNFTGERIEMVQRAKLLIEFPDGLNSAQLQEDLRRRGCRVESMGVFLQLFENSSFPESFMFEDEEK